MTPALSGSRTLRLALPAAALLALSLSPAFAQTASQSPAEPVQPPPFEQKHLEPAVPAPPPVARAIELAFGATTWATVRVSTSGASYDLGRLVAQGFYKRELIELVLMSATSKTALATVAEKRRKGSLMRQIALDLNVDYLKLYRRAAVVEEQVDKIYLPKFPERRPRKEREE